MSQQELDFAPDEPIVSTIGQAPGGQGITLYGSNDPEELIARCSEDLSEPLANPFKKRSFSCKAGE